MEKQAKLSKSISIVALATLLLLMVPFLAMQFGNEVNWSPTDFIVMGMLLFSAGISYVLVTRYAQNSMHKIAVASAVGSTLFMIWANLGVGLIGSGPNPGNLMYIGVLAIIIIGVILSRFTPKGLSLAMFSSSLAFVMVAIIALLAKMYEYPGSSMTEIVGVNALFTGLFAISGLLFRYVATEQSKEAPLGKG